MPLTRNDEPLTSVQSFYAELGCFQSRMVDLLPALEAHLVGVDGEFFTSHSTLVLVPPDPTKEPWMRRPRVTVDAGSDPERFIVSHWPLDTSAWPTWTNGGPTPVEVRAYADTVEHALACVSIAMVGSGGWSSAP